MTDGIVDLGNPAKDLERARWLRGTLAQEAKRLGVRVFGVAFTEAADFELIQSVAQTSAGEYFRVLKAEDIPGTFERISARIREIAQSAPASEVPVAAAPPPPSPPADWRLWALVVAATVVLSGIIGIVAAARRGRGAATTVEVPAAALYDRSRCTGHEAHRITKSVTRIGREPASNEIAIAKDTVSAVHAELVYRDGTFYLRDLRSKNGTALNGKKFSDDAGVEIREVPIKNRDRIRFDAYEFEFVRDAHAAVPETVIAASGGKAEPAPAAEKAPEAPVPEPGEVAVPAEDGDEVQTRPKTKKCPWHPWKATELCTQCKVAFCKRCVQQKNGKPVCTECLAKVVG